MGYCVWLAPAYSILHTRWREETVNQSRLFSTPICSYIPGPLGDRQVTHHERSFRNVSLHDKEIHGQNPDLRLVLSLISLLEAIFGDLYESRAPENRFQDLTWTFFVGYLVRGALQNAYSLMKRGQAARWYSSTKFHTFGMWWGVLKLWYLKHLSVGIKYSYFLVSYPWANVA